MTSPAGRRGPGRPRRPVAAGAVVLATVLLAGCAASDGAGGAGPAASGPGSPAPVASYDATPLPETSPTSPVSLGAGLLAFPDAASQWVATHPDDPRAGEISEAMVGQPTALWLTGEESFGNLAEAVDLARAADETMVLTLYNIPLRWDGLSDPSPLSLADYQDWTDRVVAEIGDTRAVVVLEPDALWFYDRMPTDADRQERLDALGYVVERFAADAPRTRLYLEAGTSSGSVTPERMAELLVAAGVEQAAGFAVNVSSYSPPASINAYAQAIRSALGALGVEDPRYVTDTGRNGAQSWDFEWCNPPGQRLGEPPRAINGTDGRDLDLWVKAPGTSDGDCGPEGGGAGTYGGEFLPSVAADMIGG